MATRIWRSTSRWIRLLCILDEFGPYGSFDSRAARNIDSPMQILDGYLGRCC